MQLNVNALDSRYGFFINGASYAGKPKNNTMMYVSKKVAYLLDNLNGHKECLVFLERGIEAPENLKNNNCFILSDNPQLSYAKFATTFSQAQRKQEIEWGYELADGGYYVGHNVRIGENCYIEPNVVIGHNVKIGDNAIILSGCIIKNAVIGNNLVANEYAVIGANGFTMAENPDGEKIRIPSLGKVLIGDNVEIGAHDNISRGSGGDTIIEDSVKIDAKVHIGHDVFLGKNTEITAGAIIGGFVHTGEKAYIGINAVIRNRKSIGRNAFIGMGAVVTKSVDDNVTVVGNPAKPFRS